MSLPARVNQKPVVNPEARAQVDALLKTSFRPEFLNRLDEIVYYKPLSKTEIAGVVDLMLESLCLLYTSKHHHLERHHHAEHTQIVHGLAHQRIDAGDVPLSLIHIWTSCIPWRTAGAACWM